MYEYVKGKAMWANITSPNTRFEPHKYGLTVLTDAETATKLEDLGLTQVRARTGELKYENLLLLLVVEQPTTMVQLEQHLSCLILMVIH